MFEFIGNILQGIFNFFDTAFTFIIQFFKEIVYLIQLLATAVINMPSYLIWLPATVTTMIILGIGIVVVYKVLGRT